MEILDCQDSGARNTIRQFSHRKTPYNQIVFDAHPDRRDKACSFGDKWVWISREIETIINSLDFSDYQEKDAREKKQWFFLFEYSSTRAVFLIENFTEEAELLVTDF